MVIEHATFLCDNDGVINEGVPVQTQVGCALGRGSPSVIEYAMSLSAKMGGDRRSFHCERNLGATQVVFGRNTPIDSAAAPLSRRHPRWCRATARNRRRACVAYSARATFLLRAGSPRTDFARAGACCSPLFWLRCRIGFARPLRARGRGRRAWRRVEPRHAPSPPGISSRVPASRLASRRAEVFG